MTPAAAAANPRVFLFSHELEAALTTGASSGLGRARLIDCCDGSPDVVHLSIVDDAGSEGGVQVEWRLNQGDNHGDGTNDRSILFIDTHRTPATAQVHLTLAGNRVVDCPADIVLTGAVAFTRNSAVLETDTLSHSSVLCIGLGSGGSIVVDQLARSGVGRFHLWDMDRLEVHNVGRHVCTLRDLGRRKVTAMRDHVHAINPAAAIECTDADVLEETQPGGRLETAIAAADCVVVGTDNNGSRFAINDAAWRLGKPSFYGRAFTRAAGGDVIQVSPPTGPCYACHVAGRSDTEEISSPRDAARIAYADVEAPIQPGLSVDIQPIANMIARLCVFRLSARIGVALGAMAEEMAAPLYLWGNRREEQFADWKPMGRSYNRLAILRWYGISVPRDEECETCGKHSDVALRAMAPLKP